MLTCVKHTIMNRFFYFPFLSCRDKAIVAPQFIAGLECKKTRTVPFSSNFVAWTENWEQRTESSRFIEKDFDESRIIAHYSAFCSLISVFCRCNGVASAAVPTGQCVLWGISIPSNKLLGYYQLSLRDNVELVIEIRCQPVVLLPAPHGDTGHRTLFEYSAQLLLLCWIIFICCCDYRQNQ